MNKAGPWSTEDKEFISRNAGTMLPEEIAQKLKRNPEAVIKYMKKNGLMKYYSKTQLDNQHEKLNDIEHSQYWKDLVKQFDPEELESFQYHWENVLKQFENDSILHTEEFQIIDMIKYEILMNRLLIQETDVKRKIKQFETYILDEKKSPLELQDKDSIANWEAQVAALYAATESLSKEYRALSVEKQKLLTGLKATREQRIKNLESSKESMAGWLRKMILDPQYRRDVGIYIEKMRIATQVEYERLSELHTYIDGQIDRPLLIPKGRE